MGRNKVVDETIPEPAAIKRHFKIYLLILFGVMIGFAVSAAMTITRYSAKMKLLSTLSDVRITRTNTETQKVRYLYSNDAALQNAILDDYSLMYDYFSDAVGYDRAFSLDIKRLKVLTAEERRSIATLFSMIEWRGFCDDTGEFHNFLELDEPIREVTKDMVHPPRGAVSSPPDELQYDFSAAVASVDLFFSLYSRAVLEQSDAALVHEKAQAVTEKLHEIVAKLPEKTVQEQARNAAENLLRNKEQVFARIVSYDARILRLLTAVHETEEGLSLLLEAVYQAVQNDLRHVRTFSFVLIVLFVCYIISISITLSLFVTKSEKYSLRRDVRVAELANKAKSAFLSNISHEIRSPLNAVLGLDELIIRESTEQNIVNYAMNIQRSGKTLLSLINDVLDFSKIEAGKVEIIPVEYDISSVVGDLYNMIAPRAQEKKLAFEVHIAEDLPHLLVGDEVRIKQCVLNILTNGVKYTKQGSVTLAIGWQKTEKADTILLTVSVTDTGIGIREEDMPKLFKAFERIEERRNRTIEGTGLGMAIVNNLLTLMGTTLSVQSEYGKGSCFSFSVAQTVADWTPVGSETVESFQKPLEPTNVHFENFTAPECRVLVVDDTAINLTVVKGLLRPTLIQVDTALSGHEALKLVTEKRYDLIFLDHRMPVMDGIETLRFMQTLDANLNKDVPVIALTANAVSGAREMYLAEGFADYMSKPIDLAKLEKMLKTYLPQTALQVADELQPLETVNQADSTTLSLLQAVEGMDVDVALTNCGGSQVLEQVLIEYYNAIPERAATIERYAASGDWKNYTVAVHALKSTSRLIGVLSLSEEAAHLEHCGDIAQGRIAGASAASVEEALREIAEKTPLVIECYRHFLLKLSPFVAAREAVVASGTGNEKPVIDVETFINALKSLRECMQIADFTLADEIVTMIDGYRIEEPFRSLYKQVKTAVTAVDPARVLAAIDAALT